MWTSETSNTPFQHLNNNAVSSKNRIYVFDMIEFEGKLIVFSSSNEVHWTLGNSDVFLAQFDGRSIVFKNAIYNIGTMSLRSLIYLKEIRKSTNGRDWSLVSKPLPFLGKEELPGLAIHTADTHNGKVWVVGGEDGDFNFRKDKWSSWDMKSWTMYKGETKLRPIFKHT